MKQRLSNYQHLHHHPVIFVIITRGTRLMLSYETLEWRSLCGNGDYQERADNRKAATIPLCLLSLKKLCNREAADGTLWWDAGLNKVMHITASTRLNLHRGGIFLLTELLTVRNKSLTVDMTIRWRRGIAQWWLKKEQASLSPCHFQLTCFFFF